LIACFIQSIVGDEVTCEVTTQCITYFPQRKEIHSVLLASIHRSGGPQGASDASGTWQ